MKHFFWLLLLCLFLYLPGQTNLPVFDRDEARFAQASKQMVETGDYVNINFQTQPRHKKPVGIYWLQTLSVNMTGTADQIWAYRLPSWLGAIVAVLGTMAIGTLLLTPEAGFLAGILLASTLLMGVEARMAKTDAVQLACLVLAQFALARVWMNTPARRNDLVFWAALGAGMLVKGPIVPMVCGLTALTLSVFRRSGEWLKPLVTKEGIALCLGITLPWLLVITLKTHGEFWVESVGRDLLAKAASGQEGHGAPPGYYLLTFFLTFWPWGPLAVPALWLALKQRNDTHVQFLLAWIIPGWLVFEFMPTKLLHYTLPVFPALALLLAHTLRLNKVTGALLFALLVVVALGVPLAPTAIFVLLAPEGGVGWTNAPLSILGLTSGLLLLGTALAAWQMREAKPHLAGLVFLGGLVNFYAVAFSQILPETDTLWVSRSAAQLVTPYRETCPGPVTSIGYAEPSLVFYLGTDTKLASDLELGQGCRLVLLEQRTATTFPPAAERLGSVSGFNYSKGNPVTLTLYRLN